MSSQIAIISGNGARLRQGLGALSRALWLSETAVWLTRGLAAGLAGAAVALLAARFINVSLWLPAVAILAGLLGGAVIALTRPRSLRRTALLADRRLDFRERLITAWELQQRGLDSPLVAAQLADTAARLRGVRPYRAFPIRLPQRESGAIVALVALALALWLLPNPHRLDLQRQLAERRLIAQQAQAVGQLAQQIQTASGSQPSPQQASTIQALKQLQAQLQDSNATTANALSELAAAEDRLRAQNNSGASAAQGGLDQAAAALAAGQGSDSPAKGLGQSIGQGQYAQAASQLQQLAKDAPQMTQAQRDALQSTLNGAGAAAAKSDPALGQALQQAANSLGSAAQPGDPAAEQQAFNQAASSLQQAGQAVTGDNQAQQALSQVQASEATLSSAQQAAGQSASGQASSQGDQAQQISSLGNPATGQQADGSQPGAPPDSSASGQPSDSAAQGSQAGAPGDSSGQQAGTGAAQGAGGQPGQQADQAAGQSGQGANGQSGAGNGQGPAGGHGNGGGPGGQVYAPQSVNGHPEQLPNSATDPGQQVAANGSQAPQNNQSLVPYNQVIGSYQQQATQAMDQSQVPLDKKNLVRDYFSALAAGN